MGRIFCHEPCSYPRETILLLKQKGNLQSSSNPAHWPAYKTTTSHDRIRLERAEDLEALKQADCQFNREKEILRCQASVKSGNPDLPDLIPVGRDGFPLHTALGSHKKENGIRFQLFQSIGKRYCRVDMPSRTTGCHKNPFRPYGCGAGLCGCYVRLHVLHYNSAVCNRSFGWTLNFEILSNIPVMTDAKSILVPPELTKGIGRPVTGKSPVATAALTRP